jgi:hypothetical protein
MATLTVLRIMARPGTIEHDRAAGCYSAIAPKGMKWDEGVLGI